MPRRLLACAATVLVAFPLAAQEAPADDARAIFEGLQLPAIIAVMAREGAVHGENLAESVFPSESVPAEWEEVVASIYDAERMESAIFEAFAAELAGDDTAAMRDFFIDGPGAEFARLELAAREAMLDEDVEAAAREAAAMAMAENDPRLELLRRYAEVNDLVEANVVGAMNSNYEYLMGMIAGGAMASEMTEADVLADIWSQEPQIRADTIEWLYSFLLMAYGPASDEEIEALIAFSETEAGQELNSAIFAAFDEVFEDISRALGLASARFMTTTEL
jgi:hypothetical protein